MVIIVGAVFGQIVIGMTVQTGVIPSAFEKIELRYRLVKGRLKRTDRK